MPADQSPTTGRCSMALSHGPEGLSAILAANRVLCAPNAATIMPSNWIAVFSAKRGPAAVLELSNLPEA